MVDMRFESSAESIAEYERILREDTEIAAKWRRVVEYARREGGLTLKYWELKYGPLFGKPTRSTTASCARELDVPVSELSEIYARTWDWVDRRMVGWRPGDR